jgi:hypothetical protein
MTPARWRRHGRRILFAAAATVACAGLAAGCTSPRNTLGTNSSPCFRAIPVATDAVADRGTLVGARLESVSSLHQRLHALLDARAPTVKTVCVVAFRGRFRVDQVRRPYGPAPATGSGLFAIVVVSVPHNQLVGTIVLAKAPLPLRHVVLGPLQRDPAPAGGTGPHGYVA